MGFAVSRIGAVAFEAFVGEDGADVKVIANLVREVPGGFGAAVVT